MIYYIDHDIIIAKQAAMEAGCGSGSDAEWECASGSV